MLKSLTLWYVCITIRHPLWLEQPRNVLWNYPIHTVCGPHPGDWIEKGHVFQVISRTSLECWDFSKFLKEGKKILWELEKNYIPGTVAKHNKMADGAWNKRTTRDLFGGRVRKRPKEKKMGTEIFLWSMLLTGWLPYCIYIYLNLLTSITFLTNFPIHKQNTLKLKVSQWFNLEGNSWTVLCLLVNIYSPV